MMANEKEPTFGNGKICYIEMPAQDIGVSADFYEKVFGWKVRRRDDGSVAFDDSVTEVSGTWVTGRQPHTGDRLTIHIMVFDMEATLKAVTGNGGKILDDPADDAPHITAKFSDPAGNVFGLYQHSR